MSSFYPSKKPPIYSYTERFMEVGNDTIGAAYANTQYPGLDSRRGGEVTAKALSNLEAMIASARAAELAFLNATGINLQDPNASNILRSINDIFNSKQTIDRGLQYMKNIANAGKNMKEEQMYRDVSRYFGTYLRQVLEEELKMTNKSLIAKMSEGEIEQLINKIITNALTRTYEKVSDFIGPNGEIRGKFGASGKGKAAADAAKGEEEKQAINDMISVIQRLGSKGSFGKYGYLFDLDVTSLQQMAGRNRGQVSINRKRFNSAQVDANFGGNILELITSTVATELGNINIANSGLTIKGVHTGQMNQMKADTMLFVGRGEINVNDYLKYVDQDKFNGSIRRQNIDALSKYLSDLQNNIEHVIMISDKNYSIKADFGGISAQEKMNLQAVGGMLSDFGVGQLEELINYLANCGPEMVQGSNVNGEIRTELQTLIGYFLFDHLTIQPGSGSIGANIVNLINVSGIYIPLSVYLEGIYKSIKDAMMHPSGMVSVTISLGGDTTAPTHWTKEIWDSFRESHETQSFISYKILKNIADFISGL